MQYILPTDRKVIKALNRDVVMLHTERLTVLVVGSVFQSSPIHHTRLWILILVFVLERVSDSIGSLNTVNGERYRILFYIGSAYL